MDWTKKNYNFDVWFIKMTYYPNDLQKTNEWNRMLITNDKKNLPYIHQT